MERLEGARRIRGQLKSNHQIPDVGAGGTQVHQIAARGERGRGIRLLEAALRVELRERDPRASVGVHEGARVLVRSEEHTSELQSRFDLVCRLLLEKKK